MYKEIRLSEEQILKFWKKVNKNAANGCWEWTGSIYGAGYGMYKTKSDRYTAHRVAYSTVDTLDREMVIDHKCRNRKCVNPSHLQQVTDIENARLATERSGKLRPCKNYSMMSIYLLGQCKRGHHIKDFKDTKLSSRFPDTYICRYCHRELTNARNKQRRILERESKEPPLM